jgi:hypothetical protein
MSQTNLKDNSSSKPEKFCQHCGQKTFRPHRSVRELLWEFVENWFGYDSKAYKTARALCKPASLTLDYFRNAHHHNHYVTPIRLYIFLSIIFFLLTSYGGLNLTKININIEPNETVQERVNNAVDATPLLDEQAKDDLKIEDTAQTELDTENEPTVFFDGCQDYESKINRDEGLLNNFFNKRMQPLCEAYDNIQYLPEEKQEKAKVQLNLSLVQSGIESLPQAFLLTLPILALVLKLLYIRRSRLYVEHLVLLIHSHSFMFAAILLYLGWYQLVKLIGWLDYIPLGWGLLIWALIYIYMSMKRYYQQGHLRTIIKFFIFSIVYSVVLGFILILAMMKAMISV